MIDSLVIATDGSESVERAVGVALDLADRFEASVHALYVVDEPEIDGSPAALREEFRRALETRADAAFASVRDRTNAEVITAVRRGRPETEIVSYAREHDVDLVAVGTRGRHGEHRFMLGSVAEAVVRSCPVPVLSVRQLAGE